MLTALGLAFFKLSLGMGCMMTYAAYYPDDQDIPKTGTRVVLSDLTISILAGVAIFPAVFAFGFEPSVGPGLLFITIPAVFASMPFGGFFMAIFFVLTFFAATGAILSLLEVITAFLENQFNFDRIKATLATLFGLALFGAPAALSSSLTAEVKLFGRPSLTFTTLCPPTCFCPLAASSSLSLWAGFEESQIPGCAEQPRQFG